MVIIRILLERSSGELPIQLLPLTHNPFKSGPMTCNQQYLQQVAQIGRWFSRKWS